MAQQETREVAGAVRTRGVPLTDVFVYLDRPGDVAYVACELSTGIRWREIPVREGQQLARLGARTQLGIATPSLRRSAAPLSFRGGRLS